MARRKNDANLTDFSFDTVAVEAVEDLPERAAREEKPNPLLPAVQDSLNTGQARKLPSIPADAVKDAQNYLRRAANKLNCGINIRPVDNGDGTFAIHFKANNERRAKSYTVGEVREWATAQGYADGDLFPKVKRFVSDAFREAHGLKVVKSKDDGVTADA